MSRCTGRKILLHIFVAGTFCLVLSYLAVTNYTKVVNRQSTVGILIPFTPTTDHFYELRAALKDYPFKIYRHDQLLARRHGKISKTKKVMFIQDVVNSLAEEAVNNGTDYLVLFLDDLSLHMTTVDQIKYSVMKLKDQIVSNVGLVIFGNMNEVTPLSHFITVHKTHVEIFQQFFPDKLNSAIALQWIKNVYKPYHVTERSENTPHIFGNFSIPFQFGNSFEGDDLMKDQNEVNDFIIAKRSVSVISYSLFGSDTRYTDGAIANSKLFKVIYPGWKLWIYHDNTVPLDILWNICKVNNITCINMTGSFLPNRMSWRFLIASVPFVSRNIIRDIDSRLSTREKAAVDEWIMSGTKFHVMRDHPSHSHFPISGGMWGGTREAIPHLEELLKSELLKDTYLNDMNFLNDVVWKIANISLLQHDSFSCTRFGGGHPFPTKRIGLEHVGSVFINGEMRKSDTNILKHTKPPIECVIN